MNISLTNCQDQVFQNICEKACLEYRIRFCGVINKMGKLVAGGFKDGIKPLNNEEERQMLYMQSSLEISMKKEFNSNLGDVNYTVTFRDNVVLINMPLQNHIILIATEKNANIKQIIEYTKKLFDFNIEITNNKISSGTYQSLPSNAHIKSEL